MWKGSDNIISYRKWNGGEKMKREIRAGLAQKGMTQAQLAKELSISTNSLSRKLNGVRAFRLDEAQKIIEILGVDPSIFFS